MTSDSERIGLPPWRHVLDIRGRANRMEFLIITAVGWAVFIVCGLFVHLLGATWAAAASLLIVATMLAQFGASLLVTIRRLHDWGRSGWWTAAILLLYAPLAGMGEPGWFSETIVMFGVLSQAVYGLAFLLLFSIIPGQAGDNRFGPAPEPLLTRRRAR